MSFKDRLLGRRTGPDSRVKPEKALTEAERRGRSALAASMLFREYAEEWRSGVRTHTDILPLEQEALAKSAEGLADVLETAASRRTEGAEGGRFEPLMDSLSLSVVMAGSHSTTEMNRYCAIEAAALASVIYTLRDLNTD